VISTSPAAVDQVPIHQPTDTPFVTAEGLMLASSHDANTVCEKGLGTRLTHWPTYTLMFPGLFPPTYSTSVVDANLIGTTKARTFTPYPTYIRSLIFRSKKSRH